MAMPMGAMADMEIEPDDIDVSDTATFVCDIVNIGWHIYLKYICIYATFSNAS